MVSLLFWSLVITKLTILSRYILRGSSINKIPVQVTNNFGDTLSSFGFNEWVEFKSSCLYPPR